MDQMRRKLWHDNSHYALNIKFKSIMRARSLFICARIGKVKRFF